MNIYVHKIFMKHLKLPLNSIWVCSEIFHTRYSVFSSMVFLSLLRKSHLSISYRGLLLWSSSILSSWERLFLYYSIVPYDSDKSGAHLLHNVSWISTEKFLMGNPVILFKSSHSEMFYKIGILKNFVKFTRRHLSRSLIFNKVTSLRNATLLKTRLQHRCFPVNF